MNNVISVTDFRNNIGTFIDKIIYNRESYYLKKGKSVVARVVAAGDKEIVFPNRKSALLKLAGLWKGIDMEKYNKALIRMDKADSGKPII